MNTILIVLLFNDGKLALTNSVISNNRTIGFYADGGGIFNRKGMLTLTNSIISGNTASSSNSNSYGGGIFNERALALTNSTISGNTATGTGSTSEGGGISNGGTSTLTNSTISDNTTSNSTSEGGGISNRGILTLTNDTIFGNKASSSGSHGGGISNYSIVTITFSTLCGNIAQNGGGISTQQRYLSQPERLMVSNSLIAGNHASIHLDISGKLISGGYNLIQNTAGITFLDPNPKYDTDITGTPISDLHIDGELRRNGGSPLTLALLPGSPAINAIPLEACRIEGVTTDQRGVLRPQGTGCDIGAYEYK